VDNPDTDEFLVLTAKVIGGPVINSGDDMTEWVRTNDIEMLEIVDNNGKYSDYTEVCYIMNSKKVLTQTIFPFVIHKAATSFVLILPDDTHIPLDPLM
jgi:hypothetical protein